MVNQSKGSPVKDSPFSATEYEPYHALGCAIIQQAVEDYCNNELSYDALESFLRGTLWVKCLDIDVERVLELAERRYDAEEEIRSKLKEPKKHKVRLAQKGRVDRKYKKDSKSSGSRP